MEKKDSQKSTQDTSAGLRDPTPENKSEPIMDDTPDPEEDDLDDLDDLLDEFSAAEAITAQAGNQPSELDQQYRGQSDPEISLTATADFSKQLQEQMAALMGEVDKSPEMRREIEAMIQELSAVADPGASGKPEVPSETKGTVHEPATSAEESFQDTIRKTMERMQASGEQAAAAATSTGPDDLLAQMLKEIQSGDVEGTRNEEGFSKMLMGMMEQLTNKDILYEPMKELHDKFPAWMSKTKARVSQDDLRRYENQQRLVEEIVGKFEEKGYSDLNAADREYIVGRMQLMQAAGSPPADLVGDMDAAQGALGDLDSGCAQQ